MKSADVVVACPGRLLDHINRGTVDLSHVEVLVLDEADQMVDMGFLPEIRRILIQLPQSDRQTLLFSATEPIQIRRLAENILKNQVRVQVGKEAPAVKAINGVLGMPVEQRTLADFNYHAPMTATNSQPQTLQRAAGTKRPYRSQTESSGC